MTNKKTIPSSATPTEWHWRFWLVMLFIFGLVLWALAPVLLPFVLGLAVAYFLNPVVSSLQKRQLPRGAAAALVLLAFLSVVVTAFILLAPVIRAQVVDFVTSLPGYITTLQNELWPRLQSVLVYVPSADMEKLRSSFTAYTDDVFGFLGKILGQVLSGSFALLDVLALMVLTPVIAFYLMRDWPRMLAKIDSYLPRLYAPAIRREMHNIDIMIAGFIRGQALVSLGLAALYSIGLSIAGLKYGMLIGLGAGLLSFVPFLGFVTGITTSLIMACIQFDSLGGILGVAAVFAVAQAIDGYFLTPKLVGDRVGLHPVWIIFAVLAGGKLFGIIGIILGVPVMGTIAILLRLGLRHYKNSRIFDMKDAPEA
jgi:predicted PurR-regulated permease PerM